MTVRFRTEAADDVSLARDWYDSQSPGLGDSFVARLLRSRTGDGSPDNDSGPETR